MKLFSFLFFLGFSMVVFGQDRCPNNIDRSSNDEPPGCVICSEGFIGNTFSFTIDSVSFDFPCGEIEKSQWFSIVPDTAGVLEIRLTSNTCVNNKGIEAGLYDQDLNLISNCDASSLLEPTMKLTAENLTPGETYLLMVDPVDGDNCNFTVNIVGNEMEFSDADFLELEFDDTKTYCYGDEICFSVDPLLPASTFRWVLGEDSIILSGGGEKDRFVCTQINSLGTVVVLAQNACQSWIQFGSFINVIEREKVIEGDTVVCPNSCLYVNDSCYIEEGKHEILVNDFMGAECNEYLLLTIEHLEIFPSPNIECRFVGNDLLVEWSEPNGANEYVISLNRDSFATVSDNFINIENVRSGDPINIKVQPIGDCSYLPAEINCPDSIIVDLPSHLLVDKISVFPNPTTGNLRIETDLEIEEINIFDVSGRFLQKEKSKSFDLKNQVPGIYFLKIKTDEGLKVKRIVVQ